MSMSSSALNESHNQPTNETYARIMDKQWELVQKKTFTKWVNSKLVVKGYKEIEDLTSELSSGVPLLQLLEIIGDESFGKYNKTPKMRIQKVENLNRALDFIKSRGVPLTNIGAEDILDGNEKLVLGLIWIIILRFTIAEISEGDLSAKEGLLLWCQRKTAGYKDVSVKDFTFSWMDGLALCALIHRHRPDLLEFDSLDKSNKAKNVELAFEIAEKKLAIPRLLDVEDLADIVKPDERSVMTYIAQFFHAFSSAGKLETAGRRISKFCNMINSIWDMKNDYEKRVSALFQAIENVLNTWKNSHFDGSFVDARKQLSEFNQYKNTEKRRWVTEKRDLDTLLGNINTKLKTYKLAAYVPPTGMTTEDVEKCWDNLVEQESSRKKNINHQIREIKDSLKKKYAEAANKCQKSIDQISVSLASLEGELESQLETVKNLISKLSGLGSSDLKNVEHCHQLCIEASIEDENEYTVLSVEDLVFDYKLVEQSLNNKCAFIENQIVARNMTNLTPQQLEEFEMTFRHFDRDNSNSLSETEFKAGLAGLGIMVEDETLFSKVAQGTDSVSFEQFVEYMVSITEDKTSLEQLRDSFRALAGNKEYLTEMDMKVGQLDESTRKFFMEKMPKVQEGYDYNAFLNETFNQ